ncbi:MAG: DUF1638 domain-containing protein [Candidatus Omnitrophica bacterium]|nr:DUF1638 domain-containing protein [Candidatus Omnitrophota bacterium]
MPDKKILCVACGVFKMEMEALARQGKINLDTVMLESMLHIRPVTLEKKMGQVMSEGAPQNYLILYGDCHAHMHEIENQANASRVDGINCCQILLGRELYRQLQKDQAFIFLPEWTQRWRQVFIHELGFAKPELARAFMKETRKRLVYVDTGVMPLPEDKIREITEFFDMPVEVMPVSLDHLQQAINRALQKFNKVDVL